MMFEKKTGARELQKRRETHSFVQLNVQRTVLKIVKSNPDSFYGINHSLFGQHKTRLRSS